MRTETKTDGLYSHAISLLYTEGRFLFPHTCQQFAKQLAVFIIIIILGISFMQGIYTYIPETNHVPREHRVATILM